MIFERGLQRVFLRSTVEPMAASPCPFRDGHGSAIFAREALEQRATTAVSMYALECALFPGPICRGSYTLSVENFQGAHPRGRSQIDLFEFCVMGFVHM